MLSVWLGTSTASQFWVWGLKVDLIYLRWERVYPKAFTELCIVAKERYTYGSQCCNSRFHTHTHTSNKGQENLASNCARIEMFTEIRITPTLACCVRHSGHKKRKASCSESFHLQNGAASAISVGWFPYGHSHRLCGTSWGCCFTTKIWGNDRMARWNWNITSAYLTNLVSLLRMNSVGIVWRG